jgi:hypothetical protein
MPTSVSEYIRRGYWVMSNEKKFIEPCFDHFSMFDFAYVRGTVLSLSTLGRSVSVCLGARRVVGGVKIR